MWQDKINSLFLLSGATLGLINVRRVYLDKQVKGVSVWPTVVFTLWGVWDLYYFPTLGQWVSMGGSVCAVLVNSTWLGMVYYYKNYGGPNETVQDDEGRGTAI